MKTIISLICLWVAIAAGISLAAEASFSWSPNREPNLAGYRVCRGTHPGVYTMCRDVICGPDLASCCRITINGLARGKTYWFAAKAVTQQLDESVFCPEVQYTVPEE